MFHFTYGAYLYFSLLPYNTQQKYVIPTLVAAWKINILKQNDVMDESKIPIKVWRQHDVTPTWLGSVPLAFLPHHVCLTSASVPE